MEDRSQFRVGGVALLCLAAGAVLYLGARPGGAAYLLPAAWTGIIELPWLTGRIGQSLPSLLHALAFSLLTGLCLRPWRYAAVAGCLFWLVVDTAFELVQLDSIAHAFAARLPGFFANWPVLNHVGAYAVNGRFDLLDLLFTALGCALAGLWSRPVNRS